MAAATITPPDLLNVIRRIEERGALDTAHRAQQNCSQIFRYAVATGRAERDPTTDLRGALPAVKSKHLAAIVTPEAIGALLRAIDSYQGSFVTQCALKLAPLVFVRPGELRAAQWGEIDLEKAEWNIPATRMKMRQPLLVPLSIQAITILKDIYAVLAFHMQLSTQFYSSGQSIMCLEVSVMTAPETPQAAARRFAKEPIANGFKPEALHEYVDEAGNILYWRIRLKHPKTGEKWIRPMKFATNQQYILGEPEFPHGKPLYNLKSKTIIKRHVKIRADATPYDSNYHDYFDKRITTRCQENNPQRQPEWWLCWWNLLNPKQKAKDRVAWDGFIKA
jgi:hypothetical protein